MAFATTMWMSLFSALFVGASVYAGIDDCATLLPLTDGNVQLTFSKSDQLLAIYSCDKGYAAVGETILSCVDGQWDKIPPLCVSLDECELNIKNSEESDISHKCRKLTHPRFGRMDNSLVNEGTMEVATFNCLKGYHLNGPSAIYCEERQWSENVPECKPVDCGAPDSPLNGIVEFKDTHFMATAHYKCDACHIRNGEEKRRCKPSGLWSTSVPECTLMNDPVCSTLDLEVPEQGFVAQEGELITSMTCGETVKVQCGSGYQLEGAGTATCNLDGSFTWNGPQPSCAELE